MKKKHAGGRPKIKIDLQLLTSLASIQCTEVEIAAVLGISVDTLQRRMKSNPEICGIIEKGREDGKASLRRMQFDTARSGNATMQIWLGKQYLGQKDKTEQQLTGKDGEGTPQLNIIIKADTNNAS